MANRSVDFRFEIREPNRGAAMKTSSSTSVGNWMLSSAMSDIKSFSVGNGDMFYIHHNSDNFTIVGCSLDEDTGSETLREVARLSNAKGTTRFISTHLDEDHIRGLDLLDDRIGILK